MTDPFLWMGGSPCSGKSSIADQFARRYGLDVYHVDEAMREHFPHVTQQAHPFLFKWTHTPWDGLWMQPQDVLLQEAIGCYREQFDLVMADLAARSSKERLMVEGTSLLPDCVAKVMEPRDRGIWIVPTEAFQRIRYRARGEWVKDILQECRDPERAYQNWMDRDVAFGEWVREQASARRLHVLEVSGQRTIGENADIVAKHFGLR
jgi:2-phosphoglycerate kinase